VSYKLLDGGLRRATTQRQYAKIREVEARENRVKREVTQKVTRDFNKQQTAIKELKVAEEEIVANTDLEALYRKQFKQGDIDITNLVESQERIYSARMKKYKLETDKVNTTFAILRSTAEMLPKFCGNTTGC
jgi:outer membrane protein TolC